VKDRDFRWDAYNLAKIAKHGVSQREAEHVVRFAKLPYPRKHSWNERSQRNGWLVKGRGHTNRKLQVLFFVDDWDDIYICHAMPI
jgi:uncharacterized DUF497 family protein